MNRPEASLQIVYYGPPGAGKTTNLRQIATLIRGSHSERLIARRVGENRLVSVDIPIGSLGGLFESNIVVRLETLQGELSGEEDGWSRVLADADGIVFVADSYPSARAENFKALTAIRERFAGRGRSDVSIPILMQWNKRECVGARTIAEMETELNHRCFPSVEAASVRGNGVAETLIEIVKRTIRVAHLKAGGTAQVDAELAKAVGAAFQRFSRLERESIDRFGPTIELQRSVRPVVREPAMRQPERSDAASREPKSSSESSGGVISLTDSGTRMLAALERATSALESGLPHPLMSGLLAGCGRTRGSLLLFRDGTRRMDECEVVPAGSDPLNASRFGEGPTRAAVLCARGAPVMLDNRVGLVGIRGALILPLVFGPRTFGGLFVYVTDAERPPREGEQAYWRTAATLASLYLAWQAGEKQLAESRRAQPKYF